MVPRNSQAMAQTMAQATSFETRIARSDLLVATLARASDYAASQAHGTVALEHLLLALTEDADAARVLVSNSVDLGRLRNDVASFLGQQPPTAAPGSMPVHDPDLTKILAYAEAAARQSPRADVQIDGAIVLAAIVGDGKSMAATFLKAQGLTFQAAIRVIRQSAAAQAPAAPQPTAAAPTPEAASSPPPPAPAGAPHDLDVGREAEHHEGARPHGGRHAPPIQKPLWEPMGFPNIRPDPPPRPPAPPAPARKAETPPPAAPSQPAQAREEPTPPPARPAPAPEQRREPPPSPPDAAPMEEQPRPPAPQVPAAASPTRGGTDAYIQRQPAAPAPPPGPPPLPSGRRAPDGPPPIPPRAPPVDAGLPPPPPPPRGLGASRPPPPRPNLRLPQNGQPEPELTTPWPEAPADRQPLPPVPPPYPAQASRPPPGQPERGRPRDGAARAGRNAPRPGTETGQLVENIPRRMKVGVVETVEIRIAREGVPDVARGLQGAGTPHTHQLLITRAMSVRLQGEPGRFYIEPKSPETQWTGARGDQLASDYAVWRFTVIPQVRGPAELTLIVASRSIGADGVIADTSLPEQRISIRISSNATRGLKRWAGWIAVAGLGGLLGKAGESFWPQLIEMARKALSI